MAEAAPPTLGDPSLVPDSGVGLEEESKVVLVRCDCIGV